MIVGIDLGTSTSEIAYLKDGVPRLVRGRGSVGAGGVLPSVVGLLPDGTLEVGVAALNQAVVRPGHTAQEVKRLMGTAERVPLGNESYAPQELSALVLRRLVAEAEAELGERVTEAVITVPANFDDVQRQATIDAGTLAGLRVRRLVNEPTAAAVAYGLQRPGREARILVYDLGGGTFDVTLLELSEGVLDVLATAGDNRLGGADFDAALAVHLAAECRRRTGVDLEASERGRQRLRREARAAKEALSTSEAVGVTMENVGLGPGGEPVDFAAVVTRAACEALLAPLVRATEAQVREVLRAARLRPDEVDEVVFAGGSTRIPYVRRFVAELFGGRDFPPAVPPDEAVALGAAVVAGMEQGGGATSTALVVTDVLTRSFGVRVVESGDDGRVDHDGYSVVLSKNAKVPRTAKQTYRTRTDWQDGVDVEVFQGEAPRCSENAAVGSFHLRIEQPGPAGRPVEVEMSINLSGMLDVTAREVGGDGVTRRSFAVSPVRMTDAERAAARARVDRLWAAGSGSSDAVPNSAPNPPTAHPVGPAAAPRSPRAERAHRLAALAERRAAAADAATRDRVAALAEGLRRAADAASPSLDALERELTDVLFDLA